ncbi:MAG: response regulator [Nitrososphaeraceae archaeon]
MLNKGLELNVGNNRSILVVDDENDILSVIQRWLLMHGFKLCAFTDIFAALDHFNSNSEDHDIVISDIRMPGMNGYEFVKQVKKINPQVKIILMSAFEIKDNELSNFLPNLKVDAFIKKPFSLMSLNKIVQEQYKQVTKLI